MSSYLKSKRVTDKILTAVLLGFVLDQKFTGHYLFPDVPVKSSGGKIVKFGKEAFTLVNSKRAPGESVKSIGISYSNEHYNLTNRLLEAKVPEEDLEEAKEANIKVQSIAVQTVYERMRLEGEYDKSVLANDPNNYPPENKVTLSGSSQWSDPNADVLGQFQLANKVIRKKTGHNANIFHLDLEGFEALKNNNHIKERFKYSSQANIGEKQLEEYFGVEKVVVASSLHYDPTLNEFLEVWRDNSQLAYVAPKHLRDKSRPSFGYNYVKKGLPIVEKGYFEKSDRSLHNPVLFEDAAVITDNGAGYLFINTTA